LIAFQARKKGYSPQQSELFVRNALSRIDALLDKRETLLPPVPPQGSSPNVRIIALEGRLLRHIRNQILYQFKTWSVRSRQVEWSENTFYALDAAQNFTSAASSIAALQAFSDRHARAPSALMFLTASSIVTFNPIVRNLAGRFIKHHQFGHLSKVFPQPRPRTKEQLLADWQDLQDFEGGTVSGAIEDRDTQAMIFLVSHSESMDQALEQSESRLRKTQRVADQQAISGPLIGLLSLTRGICSTISVYGGYNSLIRNRIDLSGRISQATGQTYSLIATPVAKIENERLRRRLIRQGRLPDVVLQARLRKLDEMEAKIANSRFK
jgi:hypothetical protein